MLRCPKCTILEGPAARNCLMGDCPRTFVEMATGNAARVAKEKPPKEPGKIGRPLKPIVVPAEPIAAHLDRIFKDKAVKRPSKPKPIIQSRDYAGQRMVWSDELGRLVVVKSNSPVIPTQSQIPSGEESPKP